MDFQWGREGGSYQEEGRFGFSWGRGRGLPLRMPSVAVGTGLRVRVSGEGSALDLHRAGELLRPSRE